jgi:hypothetical protein
MSGVAASDMAKDDLLLYPGVLVSFHVPRDCDTMALDAAIATIKLDIERSLEAHLPAGCTGSLQTMA